MKQNRTIYSFILPVTLFTMLGIIAYFQIAWLSDLQEKEQKRLEGRLAKNTIQTANALQDEILLLPTLVWTKETEYPAVKQRVAAGVEFWENHAISTDLFSSIYLLRTRQPVTADQWTKHGFVRTDSAESEALYTLIKPFVDSEKKRFFTALFTLPDNRMFLVSTASLQTEPYFLVCEVNKQILTFTVIPRLTDDIFDEPENYRIRVIDPRNGSLIYTNETEYDPLIFAKPDISWPLLPISSGDVYFSTNPEGGLTLEKFTELPEKIFNVMRGRLKHQKDVPETFWRELPPPPNATNGGDKSIYEQLRLEVVHREGSLYIASRKATALNAISSFIVVVILGAGIAMLLRNTNRAQRLAMSQQEFIATITHELKTPLAVISSAGQNLSAGIITSEEKIKKYGGMIQKESERLRNSIEYFLLYANINSSPRLAQRVADLSEIIEDVVRQTEAQREQLEFTTEVVLPDTSVEILCDPVALRSVIQNMVYNVLKHAKEGRYLGIFLDVESPRAKDGRPVEGNLAGGKTAAHESDSRYAARDAVLRIVDRGPGIPKREQKHLFEPFVRGQRAMDNQIEGSGVGLNLVRRIITLHGGTICLEKSSAQGSTFVVRLPLAEQE